MTPRLTALDNFSSSDSTSGTFSKKIGHDASKFQTILGETTVKHGGNSKNTIHDEKGNQASNKQTEQKTELNQGHSADKTLQASDLVKNKSSKQISQKFDNQDETLEEIQILNDAEISSLPTISNDQEELLSDLEIQDLQNLEQISDENALQVQEQFLPFDTKISESTTEFPITTAYNNNTVQDSDINKVLKETIVNETEQSSEFEASTPQTSNLNDKKILSENLAALEASSRDSVKALNETKSFNIAENSEDDNIIHEENIVVSNPAVDQKNIQITGNVDENNKDISINDGVKNPPIAKSSSKTIVSAEELSVKATQEESEHNIILDNKTLDANKWEFPKLPKAENIIAPTDLESLPLVSEESFDQSNNDDSDSLFTKIDNFVTVNEGKLSVSFKEIISLPEENIPHRADQIVMAVRSAVVKGQNEISLHMYPEDLGVVDVKIEFSEVGKIQSIKFFASKESTLELLQKDYTILERSLKEVIGADDASLSFNLKDGRSESDQYQPQESFSPNDFAQNSVKTNTIYQITQQIEEDDHINITV